MVLNEIPMKTLRMLVEEAVEQEMDEGEQSSLRAIETITDLAQERFQFLNLVEKNTERNRWLLKWEVKVPNKSPKSLTVQSYFPRGERQQQKVQMWFWTTGVYAFHKEGMFMIPYPFDERSGMIVIGEMEKLLS